MPPDTLDNNALEHAFPGRPGRIEIRLYEADGERRLEVRDDTLALDEDYNLVGSLVWAGRSSLEIVAELRHKQDDAVALSAVFTFVARKRDGSGGHMVPPLSPETPREQQLFDAAAAIDGAEATREGGASGGGGHAKSVGGMSSALPSENARCMPPTLERTLAGGGTTG